MISKITIALAILLSLAVVHESRSQDLYLGGFNGTWEGTLARRKLDLKTFALQGDPSEWRLRLVISGTTARVFYFDKQTNEWSEIKSNEFRIATHKTNAIVYATDSAEDVMDRTGSGGWVETWNFTLTHKDKDTLNVSLTQAVNNYLEPLTKDSARIIYTGFGEILRVRERRAGTSPTNGFNMPFASRSTLR